jgi:NAD(P)-dependent dehydrogenase (short-subunit alcohol dehydrogenase family)
METAQLFSAETALVTGSASSIGRGIATTLAREGARVLLADIDQARNAETLAAILAAGGDAIALDCDLAHADGPQRLLDQIDATAAISIFVHSASPRRHERDHVLAVSEETWDAMVNTNVRSGFFIARALGQAMIAGGIRGRMLLITSLHAETPRNLPHYAAGKGGLRIVTKELARAFGPYGIRVNALAPGAVPGGGAKSVTDDFKAKIPMRRVGTPDDMARTALAMLSDCFTPYVTGTTIAVDGGLDLYNWIPDADV